MTLRSIPGGVSHAAPRTGQASASKPVDLRVVTGSRHRRAPLVTRHMAKDFWADLMQRRAKTRDDAVLLFCITFQCACNWFDGFVVPSGDKVMIAVALWPEEFAAMPATRAAA